MFEQKSKVFNTIWIHKTSGFLSRNLPNCNVKYNSKDLKKYLVKNKKLFFRWESFPHNESINNYNWYHVIKFSCEDLDTYKSKTRNQIKKGQKSFYCKKILKDQLISLRGYVSYKEACLRNNLKFINEQNFIKSIHKTEEDCEYFGIFLKETNELVGFSENIIQTKACFYSSFFLNDLAFKNYGTYVLIHEMNYFYLNINNFDFVSDGSKSINHSTKIQDLLVQKFNFVKKPVLLHIVYFPGLEIILDILSLFHNFFSHIKIINVALIQHKHRYR